MRDFLNIFYIESINYGVMMGFFIKIFLGAQKLIDSSKIGLGFFFIIVRKEIEFHWGKEKVSETMIIDCYADGIMLWGGMLTFTNNWV